MHPPTRLHTIRQLLMPNETTACCHYFTIGDHLIAIEFAPDQENSMMLLPSFAAFKCQQQKDALFTLLVDDTTLPATGRKLLRKFDTGNGDTLVYLLPDGGYQFIIRDINEHDCCLLICDKYFSHCRCALNGDSIMRSFGLNNALMLVYAFAGSHRQTLLIHASCILTNQGIAYPFIAASGTGKSTHTSLWLKHIEGCSLLNDDNPIVRLDDEGMPIIYGSPWSGKTPCYRQQKARLGAISQIVRATENSMERLKPVAAFAALLPSCSTMKWDEAIYEDICATLTRIIETTPIYNLYCLPDEAAARLCNETLTHNA